MTDKSKPPPPPQDTDRLIEEEEELRKISPASGATGMNASDYYNMYDLFMNVVQKAKALGEDPQAFLSKTGVYNDKLFNAYARLMATAMKAISELNKMRNADKMAALILDEHTRELSQSVSIELGVELKRLIDSIDRGKSSPEVSAELKRLLYKRLPEIFMRAADATLASVKDEYGLPH